MQPIDLGEMEVDTEVVEAASEVPEACADRSGDGWSLVDMTPLGFEPEKRDEDGNLVRTAEPSLLMLTFARPRESGGVEEAREDELPERDRLRAGTSCAVCGALTNGLAEFCYFHLAEWWAAKERKRYASAADVLSTHGRAMAMVWGETPGRRKQRLEAEALARTFYEQGRYTRAYQALHTFYRQWVFGPQLPNVRELSDDELDEECRRLINAEERFEQYLPRALNALQELHERTRQASKKETDD